MQRLRERWWEDFADEKKLDEILEDFREGEHVEDSGRFYGMVNKKVNK